MFHRLSLWLVYLLIVLSPLPLGSNRPAFEGLIACLSGIALMAYAAGLLQKKQTFAIPLSALKYTLIAFGAVFLWGMVQSFKLPPLWGHSIWAEASAALGQPLPSYISVDPSLTRLTVLNILSYGTLFFLALQFGSSLKIARRFYALVGFSAALYAAYGLWVYYSGNETIVGMAKWAYPESLTATFVSRNAFAAYSGLGLICNIGLLLHYVQRDYPTLPQGRKAFFYLITQASAKQWLQLISALLISAALLLSNSRAGILSIIGGLSMLWLQLFITQKLPRKMLIQFLLIAGIMGSIGFAVLGDKLGARLNHEVFAKDERAEIWAATVEMIKTAPLTGQGAGTYEDLLRQNRPATLSLHYSHAHSTYLETAAEWGIPAALLWFSLFVPLAYGLWRGGRERGRAPLHPMISFSILTQAALHSLVDFSFQMPANALILAAMLGVGYAQSFSLSKMPQGR